MRRAVVCGVAGSGKATLLRWLAGQAANSGAGRRAGTHIPFLVEVGRYNGTDLPSLEQLVAERRPADRPRGRVASMLEAGRVALLLDGLAEVAVSDRDRMESWLREHLNLHRGIRCVVSIRPSIVDEQRWVDQGFRRLDLLPMSRYSIGRFVRGWHRVARDDYPADTPADREARDWLTAGEGDLLRTLSSRPALGGMSSSALLYGLLCALHRDGEHLPENRKYVYDAALDLLMVRWPLLPRRRPRTDLVGEQPEADVSIDVRLNSQELQKLLQRLAFWMVTNHEVVLDRDSAPRPVRWSMAGLREDDPDRVLTYLARECGLLRELTDQAPQFLHRTFRDHLAAKEVLDEENINAELSFARYPVSLQNPRRIEHVGLLSTSTNLTVREYSGGLAPVAALASLRRLRLVRHNQVRLDGLEPAPALHTLELHGCSTMFGSRGIDLAPPARTSVRRLKISGFPTKVNLANLASLASLAGLRPQSLWLSGDALRGEVARPAGLRVRHLTLLAPTRGRVDFTAVRGVRSLILNRTPEQHELDALPELPRLIVVPAGR